MVGSRSTSLKRSGKRIPAEDVGASCQALWSLLLLVAPLLIDQPGRRRLWRVLRSRQANRERKTRAHKRDNDNYTDLFSMAHEKSPFLDSASDESFNSLTRGDEQLYTRSQVASVLLMICLSTIIAAPQT